MRLVSKCTAVLMPAGSRQVLLATTHTSTSLSDHILLTSAKPENLINHFSTNEQCICEDNCLSSKKHSDCFVYTSGYLTFPPSEEKSLEGGQLHLDVRYSTSQEACPSV